MGTAFSCVSIQRQLFLCRGMQSNTVTRACQTSARGPSAHEKQLTLSFLVFSVTIHVCILVLLLVSPSSRYRSVLSVLRDFLELRQNVFLKRFWARSRLTQGAEGPCKILGVLSNLCFEQGFPLGHLRFFVLPVRQVLNGSGYQRGCKEHHGPEKFSRGKQIVSTQPSVCLATCKLQGALQNVHA